MSRGLGDVYKRQDIHWVKVSKKIRWTLLKRSHQCKQISHLNNSIDIDKINSQLERADIQKRILTRNIYREYELYLNLVRDLLFNSVEKGLNQIYSYPTINDNFLNENQFYSLFEKKISKLISTNLPFLTVEQLKINEIEKNLDKEKQRMSKKKNFNMKMVFN